MSTNVHIRNSSNGIKHESRMTAAFRQQMGKANTPGTPIIQNINRSIAPHGSITKPRPSIRPSISANTSATSSRTNSARNIDISEAALDAELVKLQSNSRMDFDDFRACSAALSNETDDMLKFLDRLNEAGSSIPYSQEDSPMEEVNQDKLTFADWLIDDTAPLEVDENDESVRWVNVRY